MVTNCKIHDGGTSSGQCKIQQSDYITIQNCEFYNLGYGGSTIDGVWVTHSMFRQNYFHNCTTGGFVKGGSEYDTFDSNVVVSPAVANCYGFLPGGCTLNWASDPNLNHQSYYTVISNNIVAGMGRGGVGWWGAAYGYVYNNLFKDCATDSTSYSYITAIWPPSRACSPTPRTTSTPSTTSSTARAGPCVPTAGCSAEVVAATCRTGTPDTTASATTGNALTHESDTPDPTTETGATYGDPHLTMSGGTPTTWQGWVNYFRPAWDSQSNAMLKDKGTSAAGRLAASRCCMDMEGNPRPKDSGWDIGPYEYQGTTVTPVANFSANGDPAGAGRAVVGHAPRPPSTSPTPPAAARPPGPGTSVTPPPPPSRTRATPTAPTVSTRCALTATNSAGNNTCTKTNYLTVKALDANFTYTPPGGGVPLSVAFTDTSTNSPTSWSWNFGDGGTSTAQNPSHTYTTAGYYTVVLIAANANGNDTETKTNCITACNEVLVYPTSWSSNLTASPNNEHVVSGSLANLQAVDGSYMDVACNTTQLSGCTAPNGVYSYGMYYQCASGYTPSQVYGMKTEYTARSTVAGTPSCHRFFLNDYEATDCPINPFPTTWTTISATRLGNMSNYMDSGGNLHVHLCGEKGSPAYDIQADCMRWHLYLMPGLNAPPVANFTGNPTSGYMPMAVSFTDASSNTPTSWSWTFGDSSTSTVQNPSHTYTTNGTYTVALTATNSYGNNTCTKNNYITVSLPVPVANFYGTPTSGVAPLAVSFTDTTINTPTSWSWTFGDGGTSTAQNPSHTYTSVGSYTVALKATNSYGNNTCTKTNYITATIAPPVANFSGTPTSGVVPLAVTFTDSSTGSPTAWSWNFGDSNTSTVAESLPHLHHGRDLHGGADRDQLRRQQHQHEEQLHHGHPGSAGGELLRHADHQAGAAGRDFHRPLHQRPDRVVVELRRREHFHRAEPEPHVPIRRTYTVALTATNGGGNNTNTKNNYITATNGGTFTLLPDSGNPGSACTVISGSLSDVYTENGVYWVTAEQHQPQLLDVLLPAPGLHALSDQLDADPVQAA